MKVKSTKSILKSVRLTEEVYGYVEQAPGEGFNQKFENLVLRMQHEEPERKKVLNDLERKIQKKSMQLDKISKQISALDEVYRGVVHLVRTVKELQQEIDDNFAKQDFEIDEDEK